MPVGSSAMKEELARVGPPPSLLGAVGGTDCSTGQDDHIIDPAMGSLTVSPATATIAE